MKRNNLCLADKGCFFSGGLEGIRTLDPHNANVVRSQLRYKPMYPNIIHSWESFVKGGKGRLAKEILSCVLTLC